MSARHLVLLLLVLGLPAAAQDDMPLLDDLVRDGAQWARENLDEDVLRSLGEVDQKKVQTLFNQIQKRFQGEYVVDLAALKDTAATLLPLLEANAQTRSYAAWLKSRMDYLDVAEEYRLTIPPPKVAPGQPPKPAPNPSAEVQRRTWQRQLEKKPAPRGADAYAARLKPSFKAAKVPPELVWLAEVESSFDSSARSPLGAAGLFQLMPQTARSLGLSLRPVDERLDPDKSALAAAKYLKYLHGQFKDWPLALAAYNVGEGNLRAQLNRRKARTFDEVARSLPAETQMYVPKVEATLLRREGVRLASLPAPAL